MRCCCVNTVQSGKGGGSMQENEKDPKDAERQKFSGESNIPKPNFTLPIIVIIVVTAIALGLSKMQH